MGYSGLVIGVFTCLVNAHTEPHVREVPTPAVCPEGWKAYSGLCYQMFSSSAGKVSQEEAQKRCQKVDPCASLASVDSQGVADFLTKEFNKWGYWIGLFRHDKEGPWEWKDGTKYSYTNWARNNPRDFENCASVGNSFQRDKWFSKSCDLTWHFQRYWVCSRRAAANTGNHGNNASWTTAEPQPGYSVPTTASSHTGQTEPTCIPGLLNLKLPRTDLPSVTRVVALADGGALTAVWILWKDRVSRVACDGTVINPRFTASHSISMIRDIILVKETGDVYVLQDDGTISRTHLHHLNQTDQTWKVDVGLLERSDTINKTHLVMTDYERSEIFVFNLETAAKKIVVSSGLYHPASTIMTKTSTSSAMFVVADFGNNHVNVYNDQWNLIKVIGGYGMLAGQLNAPSDSIMLTSGSILVADRDNNRVTKFSLSGHFLGHMLTFKDGIKQPTAISYSYPYVWVVYYNHTALSYNVKRFLRPVQLN